MDIQFSILCSGSNQAKIACFNQKCQNAALMCEESDCMCKLNHQKCLLNIPVGSLFKTIKSRGDVGKSSLVIISQWCRKQIKSLTMLIDEINELIDNIELKLEQEEKSLYESFQKKEYKEITSQKVSKVILKSLNQDVTFEPTKSLRVQKQLTFLQINFNKILNSIRNLIEHSNSSLAFARELTHPNVKIKSGNLIQSRNDIEKENWEFAVLSPSIQEILLHQKHQFVIKVVQEKLNNVIFGLAYEQSLKQKSFTSLGSTESLLKFGYLLLSHNGRTFTSKGRTQSKIKELKKNQILQVQIDRSKKAVVFRNLETNQEVQLLLEIKAGNPLFLCCGLAGNVEVEYLGWKD